MKIKLLVLSGLLIFSIGCSTPFNLSFLELQPASESSMIQQTESPTQSIPSPVVLTPIIPDSTLKNSAQEQKRLIKDVVTNPGSGNQLSVYVGYPSNTQQFDLPTIVLVPGGIADSTGFLEKKGLMERLNLAGFLVIAFDADGRGSSQGEENYNGTIHQDGLAAVIRYAASLPESEGSVGLISQSYGVTMATGTLSRFPDLPVRFYIDWEGPAERFDTTVGCQPNSRIAWAPCNDLGFWQEREALHFISTIQVPYLRIQSEEDHVQSDNEHALNMLYAAIQGSSPWVRLNNDLPNQSYDFNAPPAMLSEMESKNLNELLMRYILEVDQLFS